MAAKKYATVADLDALKLEVRGEFDSVRAEIKANSLNGLKPTLVEIVNRERQNMERHHAWDVVRGDIANHFPAFLRKRITWAYGAVAASFMWFFGSHLAGSFAEFLHAHHVPGF